jgi:hypothetical protein
MDMFLEEESQSAKKVKPGTWASMNFIQRGGCIGFVVLFMPSLFCSGRLAVYFGVACWSVLLFGYVAGSLWKVRHASHFWWSMFVAALVHVPLLPIYTYLADRIKNAPGRDGRGYIYLAGGLVCVETITLIYLLKHAALWIHQRHAKAPHINDLS